MFQPSMYGQLMSLLKELVKDSDSPASKFLRDAHSIPFIEANVFESDVPLEKTGGIIVQENEVVQRLRFVGHTMIPMMRGREGANEYSEYILVVNNTSGKVTTIKVTHSSNPGVKLITQCDVEELKAAFKEYSDKSFEATMWLVHHIAPEHFGMNETDFDEFKTAMAIEMEQSINAMVDSLKND